MKTKPRATEPAAFELLEEAVHLLRRAPAATLALYGAGTVPFVLGLLFFWAHTTWFQPADGEMAWGALGLVGLFAVMKVAHVEFCARLLALRLGAQPPAWSWRRGGRLALAQLRLQPWALLASFVASFLVVPLGWTFAYGQTLTVIGDDERLHAETMAQTKLWPRQNHLGLVLLSVLGLCAWGNLAAAFLAVPWIANRLLGIENIFGLTGASFFNTTFLASVTALTWLAMDPLVKAFYTLRVFHGRARRTGEDVRVELHLARRGAATLRTAAVLVVLLLIPRAMRAGEATAVSRPVAPATAAVQPEQLDHAIDEVLAGADFRWRLRPVPGKEPAAQEGTVKHFVRQGVEMFQEMLRTIGRWWKKVVDWYDRHFSRDDGGESGGKTSRRGGGLNQALLRLLLYVFIAAAVLLILWLIWLVWQSARRAARPILAAQAVADAAPDLRDENVQAAQLPADGWLALAREQAARGEWRLALRALYLSTLARLAADGLISLAKFKTNLDYERELRRRALSRAELVSRFVTRRRTFEDVWYGSTPPGESDVRTWMAELERPVAS